MAYKAILSGNQLEALVPHWPTLDEGKLARVRESGQRFGRERDQFRGIHVEGIVLNVPPIIVTRSTVDPKAQFLMDGKHRAFEGIRRGTGLVALVIERVQDIKHALPANVLRDLEKSCSVDFEDYFYERDKYERITRGDGVNSMQELIARRLLKDQAA